MSAELNNTEDRVIDSTGNVFADLNLPVSQKDMMKVAFAQAIAMTIERRKLTQVQAAEIIGVDQAKVSALVRGRLKSFSIDRLVGYMISLGRDLNIQISREKIGKGRITIAKVA